MAVQWKHATAFGTGSAIAIVPRATTIKSAVPNSLFMTWGLLEPLPYWKQAQSALLGQQKLWPLQVNTWEPLGQVKA